MCCCRATTKPCFQFYTLPSQWKEIRTLRSWCIWVSRTDWWENICNCGVWTFSKSNRMYLPTSFIVLINRSRKHKSDERVWKTFPNNCPDHLGNFSDLWLFRAPRQSLMSANSTPGEQWSCSVWTSELCSVQLCTGLESLWHDVSRKASGVTYVQQVRCGQYMKHSASTPSLSAPSETQHRVIANSFWRTQIKLKGSRLCPQSYTKS